MLEFLNIVCWTLHLALIGFNVLGWMFRRTRLLHLLAISATLFSWFVMGATRGWGYCLCTDWHFQIRDRLGIDSGESTFIELMLNHIPGVAVSRDFADGLAVGVLAMVLVATAGVWLQAARGRGATAAEAPQPAPPSERLTAQ